MTDVTVEGGLSRDNAVLLLAAVEELELDPSVVRTTTKGFVAPKKVVDHAGLKSYDPDEAFNAEVEEARKAAESDDGPHDHAAPVAVAAPVLDDEGKLVAEPVQTVDSTTVTAPITVEAAKADGATDSQVVTEVTATGDPATKPVGTPVDGGEPPRTGKGSGTEAWKAYAKSKGASDADIADLGRDALVEKYGTKE